MITSVQGYFQNKYLETIHYVMKLNLVDYFMQT